MNRPNCILFFRWTACVAVLFVSSNGVSAFAQDWLNPAMEQPLPQYQPNSSPNRYPLYDEPGTIPSDPGSIPDSAATAKPAFNSGGGHSTSSSQGTQLAPNPLQSNNPSDFKPLPSTNGVEKSKANQRKTRANPVAPLPPTPPKRDVNKKKKLGDSKDKQAKEKAKKKEADKKKKAAGRPILNYDIYRDRNAFPIDPRKPNSPCTSGQNGCGCQRCGGREIPGLHGKPYQEKEPGACQCGDRKFAMKHPHFSVYWPRPFSARIDDRHPEEAAARYQPCQEKRIVDVFDHLVDFKLVNYTRKDNGYSGRGSEKYGCLGESNQLNSMATSIPVSVDYSVGQSFNEGEQYVAPQPANMQPAYKQPAYKQPVYSQPTYSQPMMMQQHIPMHQPSMERYPGLR